MELDIGVARAIRALAPGPATPRYLVTTGGMGIEESEEILAWLIDEGLAEQVGTMGFGLTGLGCEVAQELGCQLPQSADSIRTAGTLAECREINEQGDRFAHANRQNNPTPAGARMRQAALTRS